MDGGEVVDTQEGNTTSPDVPGSRYAAGVVPAADEHADDERGHWTVTSTVIIGLDVHVYGSLQKDSGAFS